MVPEVGLEEALTEQNGELKLHLQSGLLQSLFGWSERIFSSVSYICNTANIGKWSYSVVKQNTKQNKTKLRSLYEGKRLKNPCKIFLKRRREEIPTITSPEFSVYPAPHTSSIGSKVSSAGVWPSYGLLNCYFLGNLKIWELGDNKEIIKQFLIISLVFEKIEKDHPET